MKARRVFGWTAMLTVVLMSAGPEAVRAEIFQYELGIDSELKVKSPGQPKAQEISARTRMDYSVQREGNREEVTIGSMQVKIDTEGKTLMESKMSRSGVRFQQGEQPASDIPYDKAPPTLKKILEDFDKPAATIELDAEGGETARKLLIDENSTLVENGIIDNTRMFHVKVPSDKTQWEAPTKFSMGSGQFARGNLTYEKLPGASDAKPDSPVRVKVSGDLKAEGKLGAGEIKNGLYKVSGEQTYDPSKKEWTSGELNVDVTLDILAAGQPAGSATGTMKVTLKPKTGSDPSKK